MLLTGCSTLTVDNISRQCLYMQNDFPVLLSSGSWKWQWQELLRFSEVSVGTCSVLFYKVIRTEWLEIVKKKQMFCSSSCHWRRKDIKEIGALWQPRKHSTPRDFSSKECIQGEYNFYQWQSPCGATTGLFSQAKTVVVSQPLRWMLYPLLRTPPSGDLYFLQKRAFFCLMGKNQSAGIAVIQLQEEQHCSSHECVAAAPCGSRQCWRACDSHC